MGIIRLPLDVANKIAAGEVVERPASVVKELAENSVDAGASSIDIEVAGGGLDQIRVVDDGFGMDRSDALLAFERHATSKIRTADELFAVNTLGFRGEALPSVASVAKVRLITRPEGQDGAWKVEYDGGRLVGEGPAPGRRGTTVEVDALFYNTPARLKYLKSKLAESNRVQRVAERLALACPAVSVRLNLDGKQAFYSPGDGEPKSAAMAVFGGAAGRMSTGRSSSPGVEALAMVGAPEDFRMRRQDQHLIVNGRPVSSLTLYSAIDRGLEGVKADDRRRYPPCVIWLEIDPARVDVNVHPAKAEVRFADDGAVFSAVREAVRQAAEGSTQGLGVTADVPGQIGGSGTRTAAGDIIMERYRGHFAGGRARRGQEDLVAEAFAAYGASMREAEGDAAGGSACDADKGQGAAAAPGFGRDGRSAGHGVCGNRGPDIGPKADPRVIGQFMDAYIVAEMEGQLIVIDQHVAHERILVDRFLARLEGRSAISQPLLMPESVELMPAEAALMREEAESLETLGFDVEPFGMRSVLIRAVPVVGGDEPSPEELLVSALRDIADGIKSGLDVGGRMRRAAVEMACKGAVKAGTKLAPEQMEDLASGLFKTSNPIRCPHGRPTLLKVDLAGIERGVGRR